MKQDHLQDKLEETLYEFMGRTRHMEEAKRILMHPTTWVELCEEVDVTFRTNIYLLDISKPQYRGITIYRTEDIKQGEFEVY
jgi:hypothetical protein